MNYEYNLLQDETAFELRPFLVEKACQHSLKCLGKQVFKENTGGSSKFHICNQCNNGTYLTDVYPKIVYRKVKT